MNITILKDDTEPLSHISREFTLVIVGSLMLTLFYIASTYMYTMKSRTRVFRRHFMKQFDEEHKKHFESEAPQFGYPDCGTGRYS